MTQLAHVLASLWDRIKLVLVPPLFRLLIVAFLLLLSSASAQNPIGIGCNPISRRMLAIEKCDN